MEETHVDTPSSDHESVPILTSAETLHSLQSAEQRELMDLVDRLRRAGLNSILQLPQIVVCGDQSSGKSSVLEAIAEIPFPRKENLCTRFATEIIMRRGAEPSLSCKINPDDNRPEEEQSDLRSFSRSIKDFNELPSLIDEATTAMGLGPEKAFSKDVLSIEIWGPQHPQLTLVDLPGLIHSSNKSQSDEDVELIKSLVEQYISEERTIILAVISAKNDYANQVILKLCRSFDSEGARTIGVITKPDFLLPNSENESTWLDLAQNKDIHFKLGWHMLKNRADNEQQLSFAERNVRERMFFGTGSYKALSRDVKGIDALRQRLSKLLFDHLKRELPTLKSELDEKSEQTSEEIEALGMSRSTLADQRVYLAKVFTSSWDIIRMGVNGHYESDFFGSVEVKVPVHKGNNSYRLRAVVQYLNLKFAKQMRSHGRRYRIETAKDVEADEADWEPATAHDVIEIDFAPFATQEAEESDPPSVRMSREHAIRWVVKIMQRTRGRELAGIFNPLLISHLFWTQSEPWEAIARNHTNLVADVCKNFVLHVLSWTSVPEVQAKLLALTILPALKLAREAASEELKTILEDKKRHPITYNHYFTDTLQKIQRERYSSSIMENTGAATVSVAEKTFTSGPGYETRSFIKPDLLKAALKRTIIQDMDKFCAEQALDAHNAYYKDEEKYFIGIVTKQVVERHLLAPLAEVLSPEALARYSESEIEHIAAEPPEVARMREQLSNKMRMLEDGQDAFRAAIGHRMDES